MDPWRQRGWGQRRFTEAKRVGGTLPATCSSVCDAILIEIRQSTTSVPPSTLVPLTCKPISGGNSVSFSCGYCDSQLFRGAVEASAEADFVGGGQTGCGVKRERALERGCSETELF